VQDGLEALYLMEIERRNLLTHSEDFGNGAAWGGSRTTNTLQGDLTPLGSLVTKIVISDNTGGFSQIAQSTETTPGERYAYSIYAKADENSKITLFAFESLASPGTNTKAEYDLTAGVVSFLTDNSTPDSVAEIEDAGSGWWRCVLSFTARSTSSQLLVRPYHGVPGDFSNGDGALFSAAQVNEGSTALPYVPTSNKRAVYDYSGKGNHAHLGSAGVAFINPVGGAKALNLPGQSGDSASTPHDAAQDFTDELDLAVKCRKTGVLRCQQPRHRPLQTRIRAGSGSRGHLQVRPRSSIRQPIVLTVAMERGHNSVLTCPSVPARP